MKVQNHGAEKKNFLDRFFLKSFFGLFRPKTAQKMTRVFNGASIRWVGGPTPCALFLILPGRTCTCYWVVSIHDFIMGVVVLQIISNYMGEEGLFSRRRVLLFSTVFFHLCLSEELAV